MVPGKGLGGPGATAVAEGTTTAAGTGNMVTLGGAAGDTASTGIPAGVGTNVIGVAAPTVQEAVTERVMEDVGRGQAAAAVATATTGVDVARMMIIAQDGTGETGIAQRGGVEVISATTEQWGVIVRVVVAVTRQ
ncbi:unnamed protein product [Ectocarpus sp. CCAP 1310/34]|nr:unnamed protein product [Ectocarpus sp. CCAP 1310/34]